MKKIIILFLYIIVIVNIFSIANAQTPKPKIWGVVMGISKYMNVPSLQYADKDALSFYEYLLSPAGGKADTNNIRLLLNEKATSYNFFEAMDNLLDAAKEGDLVYIYFAGHGDIEKKTDRQNGFLIGYNAPANCYAAGGSISVRFLQDYVETLVSNKKSKVILIIDACRSGKLAGGREGAEITALALKQEWKGVTKILSCQPGETSIESDKWGGGAGVFTYFMLKGMKGFADKDNNNEVSLREISLYLDENVTKETDNKQMPEVVGDKRQDLAKVDKETYLALLNKPERQTILPENLLSAGFESNINSINDVSIIKAYERFKEYIKTGNLIAYNEADEKKETALSIFRSLEGNRDASPVITSMKRELLAALQNRAQISLNKWMDGISTDSIKDNQAYKELITAYNIIDSTYHQYEQIKFRYLFWSHLFEKDDEIKMKYLEECLKIYPNDPVVNFSIANIYNERKNYDEVCKYYDKALDLAKNWSWAWNNKGILLAKSIKYEEAINCFNKAIEIKPDDNKVWGNKGLVLASLGRYEEAIKCYDKAIEIKPDDFKALDVKGYALVKLRKYDEGLNIINKALEIKPDYYEAWVNKGLALWNLGKNEEAIKCCDKAIEIKPDDNKGWGNKGLVFASLGRYEEAIKCYDKAIELKPDYSDVWYSKGNAFYSLTKYEEAVKCYNKAIEIKPDYFDALFYKGNAYLYLNKYDDANVCYDKILETKPDDFKVLDVKGYALVKLGKYDEGLNIINKALEIKPDYDNAYYNKACAYSILKNKGEMLSSLKKAIELNPKNKESAKKDEDFKEYWDDEDFKKLLE